MDKAQPLPTVQRIHNPVLKGKPLLILPEGLLVRWPERVPLPLIGAEYSGAIVRVPPPLREQVLTVLFGPTTLERCDAAKRLAANKVHRRTILARLFSRSYLHKMLASAERLPPEERQQLTAQGKRLSIRGLLQAGSSTVHAQPQGEGEAPHKM